MGLTRLMRNALKEVTVMPKRFYDRAEAGRLLAERLLQYADRPDVWVIALPRGGVPVAYEIAQDLHLPLDLCLVRKLGAPRHRELAIGAIAASVTILNEGILQGLDVTPEDLQAVTQEEKHELQRRTQRYRGDRPEPDLHDQIVILVDDGIATGATLKAAIAHLRQQQPRHIIVAVPVAAVPAVEELRADGAEVISLLTPEALGSISLWYHDFGQTSDEEVCDLLRKANQEQSPC
jgi:putative phosphoribosyl transferase